MKLELRNQWVAALRSGKYQQGTKALCNNDKFCCFGVLAEELKYPFEEGEFSEDAEGYALTETVTGRQYQMASDNEDQDNDFQILEFSNTELRRLGISEQIAIELMLANDTGVSFEELAKAIERKL